MKRQAYIVLPIILTLLLASCSAFSDEFEEEGGPLVIPTLAAEVPPSSASPQSSASLSGDAQVTITLAVSELDQGLLQPVLEKFMDEHRNIRVQTVDSNLSWDKAFAQNVHPEFFLRSAADVVQMPYSRVESMQRAQSGFWRDLRPYIDADPAFDQTDFYTNTLEAATFENQTYLIPTSISLSLVAYRKDIWAQFALPSPASNWTWSDLQEIALRIAEMQQGQSEENRTYGFLDESAGYISLLAELEAQGVDPQKTSATQFRLDNSAIISVLNRLTQLEQSGALYLADSEINPDEAARDSGRQVAAGAFGMFPAFWTRITNVNQPVGFALDPVKSFAWRDLNGYAISRGSQHPEAAWQLVSYLSRNEPQSPVPFNITTIPARKSVAEQFQIWQKIDADTQQVIRATLNRPPPAYPVVDALANNLDLLVAELPALLKGQQSAERAAANAQAKFEQRLALPSTPVPILAPFTVATPLPEPNQQTDDAVTIRFGASGIGNDVVQQLRQQFAREQPNIVIQVQQGFGDTIATLVEQTDCFSYSRPPAPTDKKLLLDMRPLLNADPRYKFDDELPGLLAPFQYDGALIGLPLRYTLPALHYNPNLVVDAPSATWSIAYLAEAAQRYASGRGSNQQFGIAVIGNQVEAITTLLNSSGIILAARDTSGELQPTYTDALTVEAIQVLIDMLKKTSPHTTLQGYTGAASDDVVVLDAIKAGRIAFWLDGALAGAGTSTNTTDAIAPLPGGRTPVEITGGLYISTQTSNAEACWQWLQFVREQMRETNSWPLFQSQAQNRVGTQNMTGSQAVFDAAKPSLEQNVSTNVFDDPLFEPYWLYRALDRALQGENLEQELADAQQLTEAFLECINSGTSGPECAIQTDPSYNGWKNAATP